MTDQAIMALAQVVLCEEGATLLRSGDPTYVNYAIQYLEADLYYDGSGYYKQHIIQHIKWLRFSDLQLSRLMRVIINVVDGHDRVEFRYFCRLAVAVQTPELLSSITNRTSSSDPGIARRARYMIDYIHHFSGNKHQAEPTDAAAASL